MLSRWRTYQVQGSVQKLHTWKNRESGRTMDGVVDGKPAGDDGGSFTAEQRVDVDVHLPYGIVRTVRVMIQYRDL